MKTSHDTAHLELKKMYDEIKTHIDSIILGPDEEILLNQCEELGDKIYFYNVAIIEKNSKLQSINNTNIIELIKQVQEARKAVSKSSDTLKSVAQVSKIIDKVLTQLNKFL